MQKIKEETAVLITAAAILSLYALSLLSSAAAATLLFLLPGYALTHALFPRKKITGTERLALSIGLSLSVNIISVFATNYFLKIPITAATITATILALTAAFALACVLRRGKSPCEENDPQPALSRSQLLVVLLVLAFTAALVYSPHNSYPYPFHTDEWQHLAKSTQIMEDGSIIQTNPYYKEVVYQQDMEIGFHVFLAEFFLLSGADPVLSYRFLPAIFACISAFMLFVLVQRTTNSFLAGLFSALFFASLKTNIFLLGPWFFVPLTMSFSLLYLTFYSMTEGLGKGSLAFFASATILLSALALVHPSIASFAYMTMTAYLMLAAVYTTAIAALSVALRKERLLQERRRLLHHPLRKTAGIMVLYAIPFLSFLYFAKLIWQGSITQTIEYFVTVFIVFGRTTMVDELYQQMFLADVYGLTAMILAAAGLLYLAATKRGSILFSGLLVALSLIVLYQLRGFTILLFYERAVYCALICLAALSGIGLYAIAEALRRLLKGPGALKIIPAAIAFILVLLVFANVFSSYFIYEDKIYRMIDEDDYAAIKWLGEDLGCCNIVLTRPRISDAVYPISRNYVITVTPHGPSSDPRLLDTTKFLMSGCDGRKEVLQKYDVDYVLVDAKIRCDFLEEIHSRGEDRIYRVRLSSA
jgi:hypothetical protein